MTTCAHCRAEVGDASHCPQCGHAVLSPQAVAGPAGPAPAVPAPAVPAPAAPEPAVPAEDDWRTDTAERPAVRPPVEPAPATSRPEPARYPLFADEVAGAGPVGSERVAPEHLAPEPGAVVPVGPPDEPGAGHRAAAAPGWLLGALLALVLLSVAAGGAWLLLSPGGDDSASDGGVSATTRPASTDQATDAATSPVSEPSPTPTESAATPSESTSEPTSAPTGPVGDPVDVADQAVARAPRTAPANQDVAGRRTTYVAGNMLDGRPDTCWRMAGDGTGSELTFTLAGPTTLTSVGLVNGYAKTATEGRRKLNWYIGNRRVLAVTWVFDDGTTVDQPLTATKALQTLDIAPVTTSTVRLRLVSVTSPGTGRSARNYTAVSEVALVGVPAT